MNYSKENIEMSKKLIESKNIIEKSRKKDKDFTRNRKITPKDLIYYNLNRKGLTSKMEIEEFIDICNIKEISTPGFLKQREKLNPEVFEFLNNESMKLFYNKYKNEVKTYKGYILTAEDGSDFEIPNTILTRKEFESKNSRSTKENIARAHVSTTYDILNKFVLTTTVDRYRASELEMMRVNSKKVKKLIGNFKMIKIMDRGYGSIPDYYYFNKENEKFIIRIASNDLVQYRRKMLTDDEVVEIDHDYRRTSKYKKKYPEVYNYFMERKTIKVRIVNIVLETGEIETLVTNLCKEEFSTKEIYELYGMRWGIETNYHYLKESIKITNITSSKKNIILQDILSTIYVFNILQGIQNDLELKIEQDKYKNKMKININMATGYIKKYLIYILLQDDDKKRSNLMDILNKKILNHIVPIRPNRRYEHKKHTIDNRYSINKRKSY